VTESHALQARWERVSPRLRDIAFVGLALAVGLAEGLARRHDERLWWLVLVTGVLGAASLWWRRQAPVAVTVVGMAVRLATDMPVVLAVGLFTLAVRRRDRTLALVAVAAGVCFAIPGGGIAHRDWLQLLIDGGMPVGFSVAAGAYLGARQDLLASLRERADRAETERELRAEQARLGERQRIAGEMHDVLAHKVSLIALHAGALEVNATAGPDQVRATAALIGDTARAAAEDLRGVLGVLRSNAAEDDARLAPQPGIDGIGTVVEASRAAGLRVELRMEAADVPGTIGRTAYRVVQEGLTNVHKHARSAATTVEVASAEGTLCVEVVNQRPVAGGALLPGAGAGLLGLRVRVALVGGTLDAAPTGDGGWRLAARLPLTSPEVTSG
jgi:signal transduction histidine kinase